MGEVVVPGARGEKTVIVEDAGFVGLQVVELEACIVTVYTPEMV